MYEYQNTVFTNNFTGVHLPIYPDTERYCHYFCMSTRSCNVILVAYSSNGTGNIKFDWCAVYMIHDNDVNLTSTGIASTDSLDYSLTEYCGTPDECKLIIIGNET